MLPEVCCSKLFGRPLPLPTKLEAFNRGPAAAPSSISLLSAVPGVFVLWIALLAAAPSLLAAVPGVSLGFAVNFSRRD